MASRFVDDEDLVFYIPVSDIVQDTLVKVGNNLAFAPTAGIAGQVVKLYKECVVSFPKKVGAVFAPLDTCYFDTVTQEVTDDNSKDFAGPYISLDPLIPGNVIFSIEAAATGGGGGGGLILGETSADAYRGDRGKTAYNHSQLTSGNPHNVSKTDVGLGNVDNTSDAAKEVLNATVLKTARTINGVSFNGSANIEVMSTATQAGANKVTPVDADTFSLFDSAAAFVLKKLTWANLKATLKTYFDTLYAPISATPKRFSATIGNGVLTTITTAHGLSIGTGDGVVSVKEIATNTYVDVETKLDSTNVVVTFVVAPGTGAYRLTVIA